MKYETTTFLFRNGSDDYTIWIVDLPQAEALGFRRADLAIYGNLDALMEQLPIEHETSIDSIQSLHMLGKEPNHFLVYSIDVPFAFIEKHLHEGYSARGDKDAVIYEVTSLYEQLTHTHQMMV